MTNPTPPLPESDAELRKIVDDSVRHARFNVGYTLHSHQAAEENISMNVETIMAAADTHLKREVLKAQREELEALYRKSEVVGVGYAIVREQHITDRLAELTALDQPTNVTQSEDDELYLRAWRAVYQRGVATTPFLQREFRISYGTANQLIDRMEREGVVEMFNPRRPRKVLKAPTGEQS